jgi:hypothetical protein
MLEKFGADSLSEMRRNFEGYLVQLDRRRAALESAASNVTPAP